MENSPAKHPKTLPLFFGTEMWERYGFYIVQSLLALYLALKYGLNDAHIYEYVGSFTALTYLSPVVGGWIADRLIGQKIAIILGAIILFINYCILSVVDTKFFITLSLSGIAMGTGLLKPNISSLLGNEYSNNSASRERGFTIFYMGITTGIVLGTTLPSHLYHHFGWHIAFASAAVGMVFSLSIFIFGIVRYSIRNYHSHTITFPKAILALSVLVTLWFTAFCILSYPQIANIAFSLVVVGSAIYLILAAKQEPLEQAKKTLALGLLCIISVFFWAFYFQMFTSLTFYIARSVEPTLFGFRFPAPYYVSVQSIGMLIFGYFLTSRKHLSLVQQSHSVANKFLLAIGFITFAYLVITLVCNLSNPLTLVSPLLIIPAYLLISMAELLLSPVGLFAITILADRKKVSTMMGIFFISLGIGAFLSGKLATITATNSLEKDIVMVNLHYAQTFTELFYILLGVCVICFMLFWVIKRLLR